MENHKIQIFENQKIRTSWNEDQEEWYFSVQDVIAVLTDSADPKQYKDLPSSLINSGSQSSSKASER